MLPEMSIIDDSWIANMWEECACYLFWTLEVILIYSWYVNSYLNLWNTAYGSLLVINILFKQIWGTPHPHYACVDQFTISQQDLSFDFHWWWWWWWVVLCTHGCMLIQCCTWHTVLGHAFYVSYQIPNTNGKTVKSMILILAEIISVV
jgi:hypothetical protein